MALGGFEDREAMGDRRPYDLLEVVVIDIEVEAVADAAVSALGSPRLVLQVFRQCLLQARKLTLAKTLWMTSISLMPTFDLAVQAERF